MAQSFLNPSSFAPKTPEFTGALGGILRMDQQNQFNQLMNDQLFLQKLGKEEAGIDLEEKKKDLPLKDLRRTNETISLEAKQPYLARLEQSGAEDTLLDREQKARMRPIDYKKAVMDLKKGAQEMDWNKMSREAQLVVDLLPRAAQLGPQEGAKWLKEQRKRYKAIGYDLPDELDNPQAWKPLLQGLQNSIPHMRALALEKEKDAASIKIAEMQQGREDARHRRTLEQGNKRERYVGPNAIPTAIRILKDPKSSQSDREEAQSVLTYTIRENAVKQAKQTVGAAVDSSPESNKLSVSQVLGMIQKEAMRIETTYRQELGLPTNDPLAASGTVRPAGQTQPAQSSDGWGIRQLP